MGRAKKMRLQTRFLGETHHGSHHKMMGFAFFARQRRAKKLYPSYNVVIRRTLVTAFAVARMRSTAARIGSIATAI